MSTHASVKATVERQFSQVADHYRTSSVHAAGEDLAQMLAAGLNLAQTLIAATPVESLH